MTLRGLLLFACAALCHGAVPSVNVSGLPLAFEPRTAPASSSARAAGLSVTVRAEGASIRLGRDGESTIRMRLAGGNAKAAAAPVDRLPGTIAYFLGSDPSRWRTGIATYGKVEYLAVYSGVDVVYYGNGGQLEYDFRLAAGADPSAIRLAFDGAARPTVLRDGELAVGGLRQHKPVAYQMVGGERMVVECGYVLRASGEVGMRLGAYDRRLPLVIDPVLSYATYIGGTVNDAVTSVKVDASGNIYLAGFTSSNNFPARGAAQRIMRATTRRWRNCSSATHSSPS